MTVMRKTSPVSIEKKRQEILLLNNIKPDFTVSIFATIRLRDYLLLTGNDIIIFFIAINHEGMLCL